MGVTCLAVPLERRIADGKTEQTGWEGRRAANDPEISTDKDMYPWLSLTLGEIFFLIKKNLFHLAKMFQAFWVLPCD